jgi:glycolate oxidase iron-sulfur subunit
LQNGLRRRHSPVRAVHLAELLAAAAEGRPLARGVRVRRRRARLPGAARDTGGWSA